MSEPERSRPLAGLVSPDAELLYLRLRAAGSMQARDPHPDSAAAELLDLGLAFRSGDEDQLIRPVDPPAALRLLLERRQRDLMSAQQNILEGWARLTAMVPSVFDPALGESPDGVRLMASFDEVVTRAAELYPSARRRLRATETGVFATRPTPHRVLTPPAAAVRAGVRFQMIYQADYLDTAAGSRIAEESARAGEEVRLRAKVPIKMLHVDDSVALVAVDQLAHTALLVRAPAILAALAEWFDLLWQDPGTMRYPVGGLDPVLSDTQLRVLRHMPIDDDETIARRLNISVTTVRRHIKAIYNALGVNSRFGAGMEAAKRNWI